nr:RHO1 GDP-GTP exchange protein 2 [Polyrhizophydium stewartii]
MGRYPLLLKPVMEKAPENHPDRNLIPQALTSIKELLSNINSAAGKAENIVKLSRLEKQILFGEGEKEDMRLNEEGRTIVRDGKLMMKRAGNDVEMTVFLFDHMFLITRKKENGYYKIARKARCTLLQRTDFTSASPIPLELLLIRHERPAQRMPDAAGGPAKNGTVNGQPAKAMSINQRPTLSTTGPNMGLDATSRTFPIVLVHLGRSGGQYTLMAASQADRQAWCDAIEKQKAALTERKKKFEITTLVSTGFPISNHINCSVSYMDRLILGTDDGLYVGAEYPVAGSLNSDTGENRFVRVIELERIMQVDVLPNYDMLLVLADKSLLSFPLQVLDVTEAEANSVGRKGKKIGSHVSFFKQGVCAERTLVCAVKSTTLTATIKVLEPVGLGVSNLRGKIGKLFRATSDSLRVYKEFYIPTESRSIHFLKTKLCVGCTKGFEIVDLESLNTQGLLDPSDETLDFVLKKETVRPISIFRIRDGDFFLCYNEFGFYIDRLGRRAKGDWIVQWSGAPTSFTYIPPYVLAFEPSFIEVRHVDTGELQQIIPTNNLRALNPNPDALQCVMDLPSTDMQQVFRLQPCDQWRTKADGLA